MGGARAEVFGEVLPMSKYLDKKQEISNFRQGETESLYDAWERFNLLLKRCPGHEFSDKKYLQVFTAGLTNQNKMFFDASTGGSLKVKTDHEVQTLIENMANNEYCADVEKNKRGVFGVSDTTSILANQAAMNEQIETLTKELHAYQLPNKPQQVVALRCDLRGKDMLMVSVCLKERVKRKITWVTTKGLTTTTTQGSTSTQISSIRRTTL